ncbi:MAG: hypothetical protein LQ352_004375 [Teloschistes flavicans]|nr:MAG: hypothetical protein LQ352_004375 [Teloschistes flavicans]
MTSGIIHHVANLTPPCPSRAWLSKPHPHLPILATATENALRIYSLNSFNLLSTITGGHKRSIRSCSWKPGTKEEAVIATGSFDASVGIWSQEEDDDQDWRFAIVLDGHESEVKSVTWSAGGNLLATCSRDKSVWIWEEVGEDDFETVAVLQEHDGDVKCVAWHPEEELLASASYDDDIRLWREEVDDWACVSVLEGHGSTVWAVEWEPIQGRKEGEDSRLVSCSDDGTIRIWKKRPHQERQQQSRLSIIRSTSAEKWEEESHLPKRHVRTIYSVAWSKESHRIVSVGGDGKIVVYEERSTPEFQDSHTKGIESVAQQTMVDGLKPESTEPSMDIGPEESSTATPSTEDKSASSWEAIAEYDYAHGVFEINHVVWAKAKVDGSSQEVIVTTGDDGEVKIWKVS